MIGKLTGAIHHLKTHPAPFNALMSGAKMAEYRYNDRNFCIGDKLVLQEWRPDCEEHTGFELEAIVTDITAGFEIPKGYVMMSIEVLWNGRKEAYHLVTPSPREEELAMLLGVSKTVSWTLLIMLSALATCMVLTAL